MKRIKTFVIISIFSIIAFNSTPSSAGMDFYVQGINMEWLKNAETKDYIFMIIGALSNIAIHELGHIAYLEVNNIDYDIRITDRIITWPINAKNIRTCRQGRRFGAAGYITDSIGGLLLTSFEKTRNSYFTRGYTLTNSIGLCTYHLRAAKINEKKVGDFRTIKKYGGNEDLFLIGISTISLHNLLRQEW